MCMSNDMKDYEGVNGVDLLLRVAGSSWYIFAPCQAKAKRATLHLAVGEVEGEHLQICLHVVHLFLMRLQYSQLSTRMAKYATHALQTRVLIYHDIYGTYFTYLLRIIKI